MFRQMLEEAFEEFRQTVAPARPEISFPVPPGSYGQLPAPREAEELLPRPAAAQTARPSAAPVVRTLPSSQRGLLRSQLTSHASVRSAFRIMEVLGPPVALHDPLDRVHDR